MQIYMYIFYLLEMCITLCTVFQMSHLCHSVPVRMLGYLQSVTWLTMFWNRSIVFCCEIKLDYCFSHSRRLIAPSLRKFSSGLPRSLFFLSLVPFLLCPCSYCINEGGYFISCCGCSVLIVFSLFFISSPFFTGFLCQGYGLQCRSDLITGELFFVCVCVCVNITTIGTEGICCMQPPFTLGHCR